jgi:hypothetical protein
MTEARTQSYGRVVKALDDLGPSKLQPEEAGRIREAADALIFCVQPELDAVDRELLELAEAQLTALVQSGRWTEPTARTLLADLQGCGPQEPALALAPA